MKTPREQRQADLEAVKLRNIVKKKIDGLGEKRTRKAVEDLKRTLSAEELEVFKKLWTTSDGPSFQDVFLDGSKIWVRRPWHVKDPRDDGPSYLELEAYKRDRTFPYEYVGLETSGGRPEVPAGKGECFYYAQHFGTPMGTARTCDVGSPNLEKLQDASRGCMVEYSMKRNGKVLTPRDALNSNSGTFLLTGNWDGKVF